MEKRNVIDVTSAMWENEVLKFDGLVMVVFWAGWCEPYAKMAQEVEELGEKYAGKVKVVRINIDDNADLASNYRVSIVPTTMFFKEGRKCREIITNQERAQIEEAIKSL